MYVNTPRLTVDKKGGDSVAYDCILTQAMYNQTFNSNSDHVMHTLCITVIRKVNETYDDALAMEYTRVKKSKKFIGDADELFATVPADVFLTASSSQNQGANFVMRPMTQSGMMKKLGHTNPDPKKRFFFLCSGYVFYYEEEKPVRAY